MAVATPTGSPCSRASATANRGAPRCGSTQARVCSTGSPNAAASIAATVSTSAGAARPTSTPARRDRDLYRSGKRTMQRFRNRNRPCENGRPRGHPNTPRNPGNRRRAPHTRRARPPPENAPDRSRPRCSTAHEAGPTPSSAHRGVHRPRLQAIPADVLLPATRLREPCGRARRGLPCWLSSTLMDRIQRFGRAAACPASHPASARGSDSRRSTQRPCRRRSVLRSWRRRAASPAGRAPCPAAFESVSQDIGSGISGDDDDAVFVGDDDVARARPPGPRTARGH